MTTATDHLSQRFFIPEKLRKYFFWTLILIVVAAVLIWAIQPIRLWLEQGDDLSNKQQELSDIQQSNEILAEKADSLRTAEQIELVARQNFGLIKEGEEAFAVSPPAPEPLIIPPAWPFTELADALGG